MSKAEEIAQRQTKAKALREEGMTQREIAVELGVTDRTVRSDLKAEINSEYTPKVSAPRKVTQYRISQYTKPETAAKRIREVFGDEFADALVAAMMDPRQVALDRMAENEASRHRTRQGQAGAGTGPSASRPGVTGVCEAWRG